MYKQILVFSSFWNAHFCFVPDCVLVAGPEYLIPMFHNRIKHEYDFRYSVYTVNWNQKQSTKSGFKNLLHDLASKNYFSTFLHIVSSKAARM